MVDAKGAKDGLASTCLAGRYTILTHLGSGGMGVAYRAWDAVSESPVVIKIPKQSLFENPTLAERFSREIRLLRQLTHPNIVPIYDLGQHEGRPFIVMRFLPGGSLSNRRLRDSQGKPRPNPPGMLRCWLLEVASALDYVHSNGIVHRDVKPGNIFFDAFWAPYLGDFGVAKILEGHGDADGEHTLTATNTGLGTHGYMAPEQFSPKPTLDGRTDQYSLAVVVYELLAATKPFTGQTSHLIVEVMTKPAPRLETKCPGLPVSLVNAVHRGLSKVSADRFPTCVEFAKAVLQDVPAIKGDAGVARLLCPVCGNLLKFPTSAAGKSGKCSKCQTPLKIAKDLGALWLIDEVANAQVNAAAQDGLESDLFAALDTVFEAPRGSAYASRAKAQVLLRVAALLGGLAVIGFVGALIVTQMTWAPTSVSPNPATASSRRQEPPASGDVSPAGPMPGRAALQEGGDRAGGHSGRRMCLVDGDWGRGIPVLAESVTDPLAEAARDELILRSVHASSNPGAFIRLAEKWWNVCGKVPSLSEVERVAIQQHAQAIYNGAVQHAMAPADRDHANRWLDQDSDFRQLVGNRRPRSTPIMPTDLGMARRRPPDSIVWEKTGNAYKVIREQVPWHVARSRCSAMGGHLVTISDVEEQEFVVSLLGRSGIAVERQPGADDVQAKVWAGGMAFPVQGASTWRWVDGRPWQFEAWLPGQSAQPGPRFLAICPQSGGGWSAEPHTSVATGFICEWPRTTLATGRPSSMNQPSTATQAAPPPEPTPEIPAEEVLARSPVVNSIGMSLKVIPAGTFPMGATGGQPDEKPVTDVRIRRPFFIGVTEVTNAQWKKVTEAIPSLSQDENCPVELVTWHQANAFCEALSKLPAEREAGRFYRLPAEAEWEYACRAGTQTQYSFGDSIEQLADHAWCSGNARGRSHPVAQKQPNAWGLHDLHGNVAEWCADQYAAYRTERMFAGPDRESESVRVVRGGGWLLGPEHCRSAVRGAVAPSVSLPHLGFRVVMEMEGRETTAQKIQAGRSADAGNSSVESRWDHSAGGQRGILELHSNGRCKSGTAEGTWETVSGLLVMKWPASNAAGESRVDACTLSPDGLSFSGTSSNTGHRIFGRRLDSDEANANPR